MEQIFMEQIFWMVMGGLAGFILGCALFLIYLKIFQAQRKKKMRKEMNFILNQARSEAGRIEKTSAHRAREFERKMRQKTENELRKEKKKIEDIKYQTEKSKKQMEVEFKRKTRDLEYRITDMEDQKNRAMVMQKQFEKMEKKNKDKMEELNRLMESTAGMTQDEAKEEIKKNLEEEIKKESAPQLMKMKADLQKAAEEKARLLLSTALARTASEVSTEKTTSSIPIKSEETKGKIIGREGRNIRALESACGVDIIIDEDQEHILVSSFDSVRREVAVQSITRLLEEGRVHPARIEEVSAKVKRDIFISMTEEGKKVCFDLNVHDVRPAMLEALGSLKYRYIEGCNVLKSSVETARLAGFIAGEMGINEKAPKRAGLFHAIGLSVDHRLEGSYSLVGAEFAKKHGEQEAICQAIRCHREEVKALSILDHIVQSAYNLFRERPGAKRDVIENYINRMKDMESIANSFEGVVRSFALRMGKEIRVLVDSGKVTDEQAFMLSRDIAWKIDKEIENTGQLMVSVIRESRMVEQAR